MPTMVIESKVSMVKAYAPAGPRVENDRRQADREQVQHSHMRAVIRYSHLVNEWSFTGEAPAGLSAARTRVALTEYLAEKV